VALEVPRHCWILLGGRHYDAECPDGVLNLFELPIMRARLEQVARSRSEAPCPQSEATSL
jgi:hypothetical protein